MKDFYVRDAQARKLQIITTFFVVVSAQVKIKRAGDGYMAFTFADRTGRIDGKLWNDIDRAQGIEADDVVKVEARVMEYQGRPEMVIQRIRKAEDSEIELADFLPTTTKSIDALWTELTGIVQAVNDPRIRQVLQAFIEDPEINQRLRAAPAAKLMHHAFIGGLLDHIVSLCYLCALVQTVYPWINRDLLIAGAVLHDIGKIEELSYQRSLGYTNEGQLLGHIAMGLSMLRSKIADLEGFPPALATVLEHLILSHHGQLEHGSPIEPSLPESVLLHLLDNTDSKMEAIRAALESGRAEDLWTERVKALGRPVMRVNRFLQ